MSVILMTSLFYKALILQGEIDADHSLKALRVDEKFSRGRTG